MEEDNNDKTRVLVLARSTEELKRMGDEARNKFGVEPTSLIVSESEYSRRLRPTVRLAPWLSQGDRFEELLMVYRFLKECQGLCAETAIVVHMDGFSFGGMNESEDVGWILDNLKGAWDAFVFAGKTDKRVIAHKVEACRSEGAYALSREGMEHAISIVDTAIARGIVLHHMDYYFGSRHGFHKVMKTEVWE